MQKKVSIIIPVYNAMTSGGGYINRCVDSILEQKNISLEELEVLIINDGSKDNSLTVIKDIQKKAPHTIKIIDQKNMGVAKTRNKGIGLASGEYTMFIDQDDWIDSDYVQTFYQAAKQDSLDVVIGGYRRPNSEGKIIKNYKPINTSFHRYMLIAAWAKIHKTSFLKENNITFFSNSYGEDFPFTLRENVMSANYRIVPYIGYNWFFNDKSVSNTTQKSLSEKNVKDILKLFNELYSIRKMCLQNQKNDYDYMLLRTSIYSLLFSMRSSSEQEFNNAVEKLMSWLKSNINELFNDDKIKFPKFPSGESNLTKVIIAAFVVLHNTKILGAFSKVLGKK